MRFRILLCCLLAACSGGPAPVEDAGRDSGTRDAGADGGTDERGFPLRTPSQVTLSCTVDPFVCPTGTFDAEQIDHVCTLRLQGQDLVLYVQADPTAQSPFGFGAIYGEARGWVWDNSARTTSRVDVQYDYGGNHHNDFIDATIGGRHYHWDHSEYGVGFRACAPPDCVQERDASGAILDNGCMPARTHPEVCVRLTEAAIPPLVDTFTGCTNP